MAFPDRIERDVELAAAPDVVWAAITTAEGLAGWFGHEAEIDLQAGGTAVLRWPDGSVRKLRIERVEPVRTFGFAWQVDGMTDDDPRRTYVEFDIEPVGTGSRLRVVETGFAQLAPPEHRTGFESHTEGWRRELGELVDYLDRS